MVHAMTNIFNMRNSTSNQSNNRSKIYIYILIIFLGILLTTGVTVYLVLIWDQKHISISTYDEAKRIHQLQKKSQNQLYFFAIIIGTAVTCLTICIIPALRELY